MNATANLISIDEHNDNVRRIREEIKKTGTGVACPKCGEETHRTITNTTYLVMRDHETTQIHCPSCKWKGCCLA